MKGNTSGGLANEEKRNVSERETVSRSDLKEGEITDDPVSKATIVISSSTII